MERLTTGIQHRPCYVNIYTIYVKPLTVIHACVHSTYRTPNKEIVIAIRECMHSKIHLLMCSCL